ncbi:D-alanyl-D-alanine carboxypeptidase family protein [Cytobacillus horneckiae]|uniref:D-alanyl-D-alanine carboxypeptidase family protein n=1 Tax=Cytobacillus horneckiae TaxID=549687 RepID=UPI003D9A7688
MKKVFFIMFLFALLLGGGYLYTHVASAPKAGPDIELNSQNAVLMDLSGNIHLEKEADERIFPASLTKIMTAIVAIELINQTQEPILLTEEMFTELYEANASMAGFLPGEETRAIDLLYGIMLPSGAEASIGLASHIAGSEANFVSLMNKKAEQLGLENTHFMNVTGLHDKDHYSSVSDMAILLLYALQNDTFKDIFTAQSYTVLPTNFHPDGMTIWSSMFQKLDSSIINNGEILGGKTGYTKQAGLCLASLANIGGKEYILITVGAEGGPNTEQFNLTDMIKVYNTL